MSRPTLFTPEERALQGNPGNARLLPAADQMTDALPDVLTVAPEAPDWLSGSNHNANNANSDMADVSAIARAAWDTIVPLLVEARTLRAGDEMALGRYCRMVAEWVYATSSIDRDGLVVTVQGPKDTSSEQVNPMLKARSMIENHIQALEKELGLSPVARLNVQRKLMGALRDAPLNGKQNQKRKPGSALGFLNKTTQDGDDDLPKV